MADKDKIFVTVKDDACLITGSTWQARQRLTKMGAVYDGTCWRLPITREEEARSLAAYYNLWAEWTDDPNEVEVRSMTNHDLGNFVSGNRWVYAKSMPQIPHEYLMRSRANVDADYCAFTIHIRRVGYKGTFGRKTYTYLHLEGWKYWQLGSLKWTFQQADSVINRAKITDADRRTEALYRGPRPQPTLFDDAPDQQTDIDPDLFIF